MTPKITRKQFRGFTLSELLIALAILGVIATFTIPKVLQAQQDGKNKSIAKEAAAMLSDAYAQYRMTNNASSGTSIGNLTPYMNYVKVDTSTPIDDWQTGGTWGCDSTRVCLVLHNGARLVYDGRTFGGTATTNALLIQIDPDGKVTDGGSGDTSASAAGKAVAFVIYFNGKLRTKGTADPNTTFDWGSWGPVPSYDPPWFSWE